MGGMGQDLHNMERYMGYYASKLHQVDKLIDVSNMFCLWDHKLFTLLKMKLFKINCYAYYYYDNTFLSAR